jgi:hypothetical protein
MRVKTKSVGKTLRMKVRDIEMQMLLKCLWLWRSCAQLTVCVWAEGDWGAPWLHSTEVSG